MQKNQLIKDRNIKNHLNLLILNINRGVLINNVANMTKVTYTPSNLIENALRIKAQKR